MQKPSYYKLRPIMSSKLLNNISNIPALYQLFMKKKKNPWKTPIENRGLVLHVITWGLILQ